MENIRAFCPSVIIATLAIFVVYAISSIMMMIGIITKIRGLMMPFIFLQLVMIVVFIFCNILLLITLQLMPPYSTAATWTILPLWILISLCLMVILFRFPNYLEKTRLSLMIFCLFIFYLIILSHLPFSFFGVLISYQTSIQFPFSLCLLPVWKEFQAIQIRLDRKKR